MVYPGRVWSAVLMGPGGSAAMVGPGGASTAMMSKVLACPWDAYL